MKNGKKQLLKERMHWANWQEPLIYELGTKGERGIIPPQLEKDIRAVVGDPSSLVPAGMLRQVAAKLPEVAQLQIVRHWTRLSEMTAGTDNCVDFGLGTCTMKYSPKINEQFVNMPELADLHPWQDEETVQGILEVLYNFQEALKEISGLDAFTLQGASGSGGVFTNARIIRAYQEERGFGLDKKDEIISTIFSHPCNQATGAIAGYKLVMLYPDENGFPDISMLKAAVSERTAGMIIGCPDDTGIYNPNIAEWCDVIHDAGGLCVIDQANANGILGVVRAREMGFDMTHFNLHKTFSSPHGTLGPGGGAAGCKDFLAKYLPAPMVSFDGARYYLDNDRPHSIGKVRSFYGNVQVCLRAYAWVMSLGAEGLRDVTHTAVLNNNYLKRRLLTEVRGMNMGYQDNDYRLHEIRFSWGKLQDDTGVGTLDVERRIVDYGLNQYFPSHEPWIVPEPMTPEPSETYSKEDLDEFVEVLKQVAEEAYSDPEMVKGAPYKAPMRLANEDQLHSMEDLITTVRVWDKKRG